jgi:hypothetical protein
LGWPDDVSVARNRSERYAVYCIEFNRLRLEFRTSSPDCIPDLTAGATLVSPRSNPRAFPAHLLRMSCIRRMATTLFSLKILPAKNPMISRHYDC